MGSEELGVESSRSGGIGSQRDLESILDSVSNLLCDPVWSTVLSPSLVKAFLSPPFFVRTKDETCSLVSFLDSWMGLIPKQRMTV